MDNLQASLELLKFKALTQTAERGECELNINDVNEILVVAGMGVITPDSLNKKDLEVM